MFLHKFTRPKGFHRFFCYLKEEQTYQRPCFRTLIFLHSFCFPAILFPRVAIPSPSISIPFTRIPFLLQRRRAFYWFMNWSTPPKSPYFLSLHLLSFFHAFLFAPILVSSSFTAKSRRYSLFPSLRLQRWIPCFPGQLEENFYPPIDGSTCEFSKWREQADFRVATSLVFPFKHKSRPTCRGKHVYRSRGRFH